MFENMELADFGNRIPSLTFEIVADSEPVSIGAIARDVGDIADAGGDAGLWLDGYSAYGGSARAVIERLADAAGAWPMQGDTGVQLAVGSGAATNVRDHDRGAGAIRTLTPADRVPTRVTVSHYDPARDYQAGLQSSTRPGSGYRNEAIELPAALSAAAAKHVADSRLAQMMAERERRTICPGWSGLAIAPGNRVRIEGESGIWRVGVAALDHARPTLELIAIAPAQLMPVAASGRVLGAPDLIEGTTVLYACEMPNPTAASLAAPRLLVFASGTEAGWRRAALSMSMDGGASWEAIGATAAPAIMGTVESGPGACTLPVEDRHNVVVVQLGHGAMQLNDASPAALDAGANLALVGDELLQFGRAEPLGAGRWRLSTLWRGRRGTEHAIGGASAGDRFVLLEQDRAKPLDLPAGFRGSVAIMAMSANAAEPATADAVADGASTRPPSPVAPRQQVQPDGAIVLRWVRRSRGGWQWIDGVDAPIGEEAERYTLHFSRSGEDAWIESTSEALFTVPTAWRDAGPLTVEIRQQGDHGASLPLFALIPAI
ncbi:MAG: phage tail protein [Sphingomonas sp.]|nr:phage tail protein [Sphingomonas sp.]